MCLTLALALGDPVTNHTQRHTDIAHVDVVLSLLMPPSVADRGPTEPVPADRQSIPTTWTTIIALAC